MRARHLLAVVQCAPGVSWDTIAIWRLLEHLQGLRDPTFQLGVLRHAFKPRCMRWQDNLNVRHCATVLKLRQPCGYTDKKVPR